MGNIKIEERREFIKRSVGFGTLVWLTPAIMSVTAERGYAQLSGQGSQEIGSNNNSNNQNINPNSNNENRGRGRRRGRNRD